MITHLCKEEPCPDLDRETSEIFRNGFKSHYLDRYSVDATETVPLFDESHTCTCRWFHWQEDTSCVVHPKK